MARKRRAAASRVSKLAGVGAQVAPGRQRVLVRRLLLLTGALALLLPAGWIGMRAHYDSWHPCDWLLQERVDRALERRGIDPDSASIPLKATTAGSAEVQSVLRLRPEPLQCLATRMGDRIDP